jgi:radical SAM protein with 4Fe4S-binding SPASM domain
MLRRIPTATPLFPAYVVWELTLRCDQPCTHCGSRAGDARASELSEEEALTVVAQLAAAGTREVVLIGGEAYLHPGFLAIVRALEARGIRPSMTTGGRGITAALAGQMAEAGLHTVSVSIDGLAPTHDLMRAARGSFDSATEALGHLKAAGVHIAANTNLNRLNRGDLEGLYEHLKTCGVRAWQVQITAPLGRAADRPAMLLQPWDLLDLLPRIAILKKRAFEEAGILLMPGNNLGYFGPEEGALRSPQPAGNDHWQGCQAGKLVAGIESNGAFKGCPSLQSAYIGGNLREQPLAQIWNTSAPLAFARHRTVEDLWGFCRTCPFAATCMGGCSFTAHALFGRPGNNPYCHFRARAQAAEGVRERLVLKQRAPGQPFDNGLFEIVVEPLDAPEEAPVAPRELVRRRLPLV